jgi:hypothetical protein
LTLAAWAIKTAVTLELSARLSRSFKPAQCQFLRVNGYPPAGVSVHAAAYSGNEGPFTYFHGEMTRVDELVTISFHTIQVGNLVLQVSLYDPPSSNAQLLALESSSSKYDVPVYPPIEKWRWPGHGTSILDDGLLDSYAKRFWELDVRR